MHRFFVSKSGFEDQEVRLSAEQAHQVCHVLRLQAGAAMIVLDNAGYEYDVTLTTVTKREVTGRVTGKRHSSGEPRLRITLFQSLLAREKFEWVLQKGTEVGVARFVPVQTERSIARAKRIDAKKLTRWRRILTEAAEQSHRGLIPEIEEATTWNEALSKFGDFDRALIAATSGRTCSLKEAVRPDDNLPASIAILVGPEGGFSDDEVRQACAGGAVPVGLGPRILRTETAAMVLSAITLHELGELEP
ncbi:MAG: 16S rRNA (uracil(1498)-N(3))-methyltransferase [Phycisphaerales bacterium]|nr:MAG: 16S rRNA (uracil(1498)-N(3))-methyltransferase [Phycisphaerales bacterium]